MGKPKIEEKRAEAVQQIMEAAAEVFGEVGFAGARMDEIASRAGVNKAMIYYRVGDKKAIYAKVLHTIFLEVAERVSRAASEGQSPEEKLAGYIRNLTSMPDKHPYMPNLMMWEFASGGRNFPELVVREMKRILGILTEIIKEGVAEGIFVDINPFIIQMMIGGTMCFYGTTDKLRVKLATTNAKIAELDKDSPERISRIIEELVLKAIKKKQPIDQGVG